MAKTWSDTAGELTTQFESLQADLKAARATRDEARAAWNNAQALVFITKQRLDECRALLDKHLKKAGSPD